MNLKGLKKPQLLELASQWALQIAETRRKPEFIEEFQGLEANDEELEETLQCFALEQFFRRLPEDIRYWVQDRPGVDTITRAAELTKEYVTRRAVEGREARRKEMGKYRPDKPPRWATSSQYRPKESSDTAGSSDENVRDML
ncbi:hypothetical protein HPB52_005514 [Rhipicephalus sanguineus]|uniref:SCAN box domain-containing protein n=1 Tax=Rhipicephalus sanguineus TaxID=34632 RepID=A0A9D4SSH2_RHISA|nr:hypothetical protein HPB52_005514 [Rhipicephalus sanguineus]